MAILSNGKVALISGNELQIWDMTSYVCINILLERVNMVLALPDDKIVVSTYTLGLVFFDVNNNYEQYFRKRVFNLKIDDIFLLTNGNLLCTHWHDSGYCKFFNSIRVLDRNSDYNDKEIIQVNSPFSALTNLSNDKFAAPYDEDIYLWNIDNRYQSFKILNSGYYGSKYYCLMDTLLRHSGMKQ
jgi:hypothetical protein